mgnify:CR=1 FL=1|tara:strand:+ start:53 stop:208 length:156 start_codon:yes stop_codon:yes gene_type:complete
MGRALFFLCKFCFSQDEILHEEDTQLSKIQLKKGSKKWLKSLEKTKQIYKK